MLSLPVISRRKKQPYLAIRSNLGMRQLKKQGPLFLSEVSAFMKARGIESEGPAFFRYNSMDDDGQMEMEFGFFTSKSYPGAGPVRSGILPSGRFATSTWHGPYDKLRDVTAMVIGWAKETGVAWDVEKTEKGEIFACRLEVYEIGPADISDSSQWQTDVAIKVADPAEF